MTPDIITAFTSRYRIYIVFGKFCRKFFSTN